MISLKGVSPLFVFRGVGSAISPVCTSVRGVRHRETDATEFVVDATTDQHAAILDSHYAPPYNANDLTNKYLHHGELTREAYAMEKAKMKFKKRVSFNLNFDHIPVEDQVVLMFPSQGAQFVGMGTKLLDHPSSSRLFERASEILGYDLADVCTRGPKSKLDQTIYCQPAVFVSSMAALEKMKSEEPSLIDRITAAAGFSIGEYCALVAGDAMSFEDALQVVKIRAEATQECCQLVSSGMLTVRTTAASQLEEAMRQAREISYEAGEEGICDIANYLYCGLKVIGGSEAALDFLEHSCTQHQFQIIKRLPVAGAFHTSLMKSAEGKVAAALTDINIKTPRINVYSNLTGKIHVYKPNIIRKSLASQIHAPVKWEQIVQLLFRMHENHVFPSYVEVGPGQQLGTILYQVSKKAHANYNNYPC